MEVNETLHVVTQLNPDALSIASNLDAERAQGKSLDHCTVSLFCLKTTLLRRTRWTIPLALML